MKPWDGVPDHELLRRSAAGEKSAFTELYERHNGAVYRYTYFCGGPDVAEETTQAVFAELIRKPLAFAAERGSLAGYLCGLARNLIRRHRRQERRNISLEDDALTLEDLASPPLIVEAIVESERRQALRRAVAELPEVYREAVVLCGMQELSQAEAARILHVSEITVRTRLFRARALLAQRLREELECRTTH